ncbi:hypothetical protein HRI_004671700 [Hibiscus trionum]|uniref:Tf2-1-like SH3-like domain-containing protein n=1 Tax=Hibiscus trionum TaxID=183268 RepID=A0A9W7J8L3_HIBTR|nr:hypothetical protein HRI_004671700 [Hibiscus trionum]
MLRACIIDFGGTWEKSLPLVEFAYNNSYQASIQMDPYEALYGRQCRTLLCWSELGEGKMLGANLLRKTEERVIIIHDRLKATFDRQKVYVDLKRRDIKYEVGEKAFLKVGLVAYRILLPSELSKLYDVFHVSMLQKYHYDPSHIVEPESVELQPNLSYEEEPVRILAREVKRLRNKIVPLVKML